MRPIIGVILMIILTVTLATMLAWFVFSSEDYKHYDYKHHEQESIEIMEKQADLIDNAYKVIIELDRKNVTFHDIPYTISTNLTIANPTDYDFTVLLTVEVPEALKELAYVEAWIKVGNVKKYVYLPDVPKLDNLFILNLPRGKNITAEVGLDIMSIAKSLEGWSGCCLVKADIVHHGSTVITKYASLKISFT